MNQFVKKLILATILTLCATFASMAQNKFVDLFISESETNPTALEFFLEKHNPENKKLTELRAALTLRPEKSAADKSFLKKIQDLIAKERSSAIEYVKNQNFEKIVMMNDNLEVTVILQNSHNKYRCSLTTIPRNNTTIKIVNRKTQQSQ